MGRDSWAGIRPSHARYVPYLFMLKRNYFRTLMIGAQCKQLQDLSKLFPVVEMRGHVKATAVSEWLARLDKLVAASLMQEAGRSIIRDEIRTSW